MCPDNEPICETSKRDDRRNCGQRVVMALMLQRDQSKTVRRFPDRLEVHQRRRLAWETEPLILL